MQSRLTASLPSRPALGLLGVACRPPQHSFRACLLESAVIRHRVSFSFFFFYFNIFIYLFIFLEYKDSDILFMLVTLKEENGIVKVVYSLIVTFLSLGFKGTKT